MYQEQEEIEIEAGNLLIAEPFMLDPNFKFSVILLCEHHEKGGLGFILNKSLRMDVNDLLANFPEFDAEVYYGGPVQTNTIHFLHNVGDILDDSYHVIDNIYMGGDFEQLKLLIRTGVVKPHNIRFFVGYSGWGGGQLKGELTGKSWVLSSYDPNYVFNHDKKENLWEKVLKNKGDRYSIIAQVPENLHLS